MAIRKYKSPTIWVANTAGTSLSFSTATASLWKHSSDTARRIHTPYINGKILAITTSFNSADTNASFTVTTRDLSSTNILTIEDWSTNKTGKMWFPLHHAHSAGTTTAYSSFTVPVPVAGSLELRSVAATSANTMLCEIYYETTK